MIRIPSNIKLVICAFVFFFGCKHASLKDIQGKVVDENGDPLEGARIVLRYHIPTNSTIFNKYPNASVHEYHYDSTSTDGSGSFKFKRREKLRWEYHLYVNYPGYKYNDFELSYYKNPIIAKMEMPYGSISIRVKKNANGFSKIRLSGDVTAFSAQNNFAYDSLIVKSRELIANRNYSINWWVNDTSNFSVNISLKKGENVTQLIEYD